jgi:hypothetical protein
MTRPHVDRSPPLRSLVAREHAFHVMTANVKPAQAPDPDRTCTLPRVHPLALAVATSLFLRMTSCCWRLADKPHASSVFPLLSRVPHSQPTCSAYVSSSPPARCPRLPRWCSRSRRQGMSLRSHPTARLFTRATARGSPKHTALRPIGHSPWPSGTIQSAVHAPARAER